MAKEEKKGDKKILKKLTVLLWVGFVLIFVGFPVYIWAVSSNMSNLFGELPSYSQLENPEQNLSSLLFSADDEILGAYYRDNRKPVTYDQLGPNLINALKATEDIRFNNHSGIDLRSMLRAAFGVLTFNPQGGGSTVTQQLAKNLFDTRVIEEDEKGKLEGINRMLDQLIYKTKEWILAVRLERSYTKDELMAMYFNQVSFGNNTFGIQSAAESFFNKKPKELNVEEAAVLVGLQKAVTRYNPIRNPENSKARRNVVLNQMVRYGYLEKAAYDTLAPQDIVLDYNAQDQNFGPGQYFRAEVQKDLIVIARDLGYDLFADGLKIYTTIDSRMQRYAEQAVDSTMRQVQANFFNSLKDGNGNMREPWIDSDGRVIKDFLQDQVLPRTERYRSLEKEYGKGSDSIDYYLNKKVPMKVFSWKGEIDTVMSPMDSLKYYKHFLQAGFMAADPHNGEIKAWVGGIDYKYFKFDHVRLGKRQAGSLFKPFLYATAVEKGFSPCYEFEDQPITIKIAGQNSWSPQNSDNKFTGEKMTMKTAMAKSVNSISARVMDIVKPDNVSKMAGRLGVESKIDPYYSIALGTVDVSVKEMVSAFGTFANKGTHIEAHYVTKIEDRFGNVIWSKVPQKKRAISEDVAYVMLNMLQENTTNGSGIRLWSEYKITNFNQTENSVGSKTGTTQNASDGWFMAVTKDLVAGAWVGGDDRAIHFRSWPDGQGARTALPIVGRFFEKVYKDTSINLQKGVFERPANLQMEIDCQKFQDILAPQDTTSGSTIYDPEIY
ncbi:penicillin-binding protein 1A [Roseivirga seohaensis]|uniref:penicillin-binding protein 1A n=1 Tax=Roseivirga seohaensis TaxID=1914963 RepID=UPI0008F69231|nr:transglycosylase domain-containing protein [Roseivirga seohaensis]